MKYLFKIDGQWEWSKIYYDVDQDCFIDERYHEEYLDTGTICDGYFPISDAELWGRIVRGANEDGIAEYINIRGTAPSIAVDDSMSFEDFRIKLFDLKYAQPYMAYSILKSGSTIVILNEKGEIFGVLANTEYMCVYISSKKIGFYTLEEALAYAFKRISDYHNFRIEKYVKTKYSDLPDNLDISAPPKKKRFFWQKNL